MTPFHPEHLALLRQVTDLAWHPDGTRLCVTVSWADLESDDNRSQLHLVGLDGTMHQLTRSHRAAAATWSPDGSHLAYLAWGEPRTPGAVRVLPVDGGEPVELTGPPDGVVAVEWAPDGDGLLVLAPRRPAADDGVDDTELARRPRIIDTYSYRADGRGWTHDRPLQLAKIGFDGAVVWLTDAEPLGALVVSSGVVLASRRVDDASGRAEVVGIDPASGETTVLCSTGQGSWSPVGLIGDEVVVLGRDVHGVGPSRVHVVRSGEPVLIDHDDVNRSVLIGGAFAPTVVGTDVYAPAVRNGTVQLDRLDGTGASGAETVVQLDGVVVAADVHSEGGIAVATASLERPSELHLQLDDGSLHQLTDVSREFRDQVELAPSERVDVPAGDHTVPAFLVRPHSSTEPGPGLLYIHGGPYAQYSATIFDEAQVAASCGYTVLYGNPHGSDGLGEAWARSICGDLGGPDWHDIQALGDHLASLPGVDPDRLGVGGGSYGGWMTSTVITRTNRYRAALIERPVTNWETFVSTSDIGVWFADWYSDSRDVEALRAISPVHHLDEVETPTLIIHSEHDWRCPIEQAEQLFVGLKRRGVPVRLARFPDEGHELSRSGRPSRRLDRFELIHDFYADHLGGKRIADLATPAPPDAAPL